MFRETLGLNAFPETSLLLNTTYNYIILNLSSGVHCRLYLYLPNFYVTDLISHKSFAPARQQA